MSTTERRVTRTLRAGAVRAGEVRAEAVTARAVTTSGSGEREGRRRGSAATAALSAVLVAAVAAVTLSGCGIRSTAVPVDAGIPASRTACPPTPGATGAPSGDSTGPAVLTTQAPTYVLPGGATELPSQPPPSETPWEALTSSLPVAPPPGATGTSGAGPSSASGSGRAAHGSAEPRPASTTAPAVTTSSAPSTPSTPSSTGFSLNDCPGATSTGSP